jgi:hypothetical protein
VSEYSVLFKCQRSTRVCPSLLFVVLSLGRNYHMRIPLWSSIFNYTDIAKRIAGDAAIYQGMHQPTSQSQDLSRSTRSRVCSGPPACSPGTPQSNGTPSAAGGRSQDIASCRILENSCTDELLFPSLHFGAMKLEFGVNRRTETYDLRKTGLAQIKLSQAR